MSKTPKKNPVGRPIAENPADAIIVLRVQRKRKAAYVRAAKPGTLAAWIIAACDKSAGYEPPATE